MAFGAVGLATGAVWATGFTQTTAVNGVTDPASAMTKGAPAPVPSDLDTVVSKLGVAPDAGKITFDWNGRWGSIPADKALVKVDLSAAKFSGKTYNLAFLLANTSDLTEYASLQLKFDNISSALGDCTDADYTAAPAAPKVMNIDNKDAAVYWNGVAGGAVYCIGIAQASGDDTAGTFIRAAQDLAPAHWPKFITTVDRAS
jgi:hypothetical protein